VIVSVHIIVVLFGKPSKNTESRTKGAGMSDLPKSLEAWIDCTWTIDMDNCAQRRDVARAMAEHLMPLVSACRYEYLMNLDLRDAAIEKEKFHYQAMADRFKQALAACGIEEGE